MTRIEHIESMLAEGHGVSEMSRLLGYKTPGGLSHWLRRNTPDLYAKVRAKGHPGGKPVGREEAIRRLRILKIVVDAGYKIENLATWARVNVRDSVDQALEDYGDSE